MRKKRTDKNEMKQNTTALMDFVNIDILASVSFLPLLIIKSVARVSQHVLFTHKLLVKQV